MKGHASHDLLNLVVEDVSWEQRLLGFNSLDRDKDDSVPAHENHGDVLLWELEYLLVFLLVNLGCSDGLLHVAEVQVLVVGVEPPLELPLTFLTDVDSLVQGEPHKVKGHWLAGSQYDVWLQNYVSYAPVSSQNILLSF